MGLFGISRIQAESEDRQRKDIMMLNLILTILFIVFLFKITGLVFHVIGTVLGWIFGILGWLFLASLAVSLFSLSLIAVPVILVVGVAALIFATIR